MPEIKISTVKPT